MEKRPESETQSREEGEPLETDFLEEEEPYQTGKKYNEGYIQTHGRLISAISDNKSGLEQEQEELEEESQELESYRQSFTELQESPEAELDDDEPHIRTSMPSLGQAPSPQLMNYSNNELSTSRIDLNRNIFSAGTVSALSDNDRLFKALEQYEGMVEDMKKHMIALNGRLEEYTQYHSYLVGEIRDFEKENDDTVDRINLLRASHEHNAQRLNSVKGVLSEKSHEAQTQANSLKDLKMRFQKSKLAFVAKIEASIEKFEKCKSEKEKFEHKCTELRSKIQAEKETWKTKRQTLLESQSEKEVEISKLSEDCLKLKFETESFSEKLLEAEASLKKLEQKTQQLISAERSKALKDGTVKHERQEMYFSQHIQPLIYQFSESQAGLGKVSGSLNDVLSNLVALAEEQGKKRESQKGISQLSLKAELEEVKSQLKTEEGKDLKMKKIKLEAHSKQMYFRMGFILLMVTAIGLLFLSP